MSKHKSKSELDALNVIGTMVKANVMAYVVTAVFILFASIILTYTNANPNLEGWIATAGICISAFMAGFDTAKIESKNGYKWGAVGGALYFVVFLVLGIVIEKVNNLSAFTIIMLATMVMISSMIAGMISVNCKK